MRLLRDRSVMLPRAARLPSVGAHRPVLMLRWWWNSVFSDDDKVLLLRLSGNFGLGTAYGWVDWCMAIRTKVLHDLSVPAATAPLGVVFLLGGVVVMLWHLPHSSRCCLPVKTLFGMPN
jgi:hypothetical protein